MMKTSVALCTYNGEKFLHQQIDSILAQTESVHEIIVCDDGSTDHTKSILTEYQNQFPNLFRIYYNENNLGSIKNFEKAISLCTGDIIFLSDQDDVWNKRKIEVCLNYFQRHPNIEVICSNGFIIDDHGKTLEKYTVWDIPSFLQQENKEIDFFKVFSIVGNIATGASMAVRKDFSKAVMPFPLIKDFHHDEWLAITSAEDKKFGFLNEKLFSYRVHNSQQVGGISYSKDKKAKEKLMQKFDLNYISPTFRDYKIKIRSLRDKERKFKGYLQKHQNSRIERFLKFIQSEKIELIRNIRSKNFLFYLFFKYLY